MEDGIILIAEGLVYFVGDGGIFDVEGSQDAAGALIVGGDIITGIVEAQHVLPPLVDVLLEDVVLPQLLPDDLLSCIFDKVAPHGIPTIFSIVEAVVIVAIAGAARGGVGDIEID